MASRRRGCRLLIAITVLALFGTGCVPSGGEVSQVRTAAGEGSLTAQGIRVLAQPPAPGASPERLARQFLAACADPDDNFAVARQFLAPAEAKRWHPQGTVQIYDADPGGPTLSRTGTQMTITAPAVATVKSGDYALVSNGSNASLTFDTVRVHGEWRFRDMPNGLLLAAALLFAYKPVDEYFLAPQSRALVPDRVFLLASRAGLVGAAVRTLLRGPSPALVGAVDSAFPPGSRLRAAPALSSGVLSVDVITGSVRPDRPAMAAQLLWTASQLSEVSAVRLRIDGLAYTSGSEDLLKADPDASAYNPDVLPPTAPGYYVVPGGRDHNLLVSTAGQSWPLGGGGPLRHPAISDAGDSLAALSCTAVRCGSLYVGTPGHVTTRADLPVTGTLTAPAWDSAGAGAVWTVDSATGRAPTVWRVPLGGRRTRVSAPLGAVAVRVLRLSRDGARVALIAVRGGTPIVQVGVVLRAGGTARIARLQAVAPTLIGAVDLSWADADHLAVLAKSDRTQSSVTPYRIRIDGSEAPQPVLGTVPGGLPVTIAAAPSQALLVATVRPGQPTVTGVSALQGQVWSPLVERGGDPIYPG